MTVKYSADDIKELAREYLANSPLTDKLTPELVLSSFIVWLKQRQPTRSHAGYCGLRDDHEGHCSAVVTRLLGV